MLGHWENAYGTWLQSLKDRNVVCSFSRLSLGNDQGEMAILCFEPLAIRSYTLLIHGTGNDALFAWNRWIEQLLEEGTAVMTIDLEGHGRSSSSLLQIQNFAASARHVNSFLRERAWPSDRLTICGYSLGGLYAMEALAEGWLQARRLLIMATPLAIELSWAFLASEALSCFHPVFLGFLRDYGWRSSLPAFASWRRSEYPIRIADGQERNYAGVIKALFETKPPRSRAAMISVPTLLIYGAQDRLAPPQAAQDLAALLPESETLIVRGANHFLLPLFAETTARAIPWLSLRDVALS